MFTWATRDAQPQHSRSPSIILSRLHSGRAWNHAMKRDGSRGAEARAAEAESEDRASDSEGGGGGGGSDAEGALEGAALLGRRGESGSGAEGMETAAAAAAAAGGRAGAGADGGRGAGERSGERERDVQ